MKLLRAFALLIITACAAQAQYAPVGAISSWVDGYVITTSNDTIVGQVRIGTLVNDAPASAVVRTPDGKKQTIKDDNLRLIAQRIPDYAYKTGAIPRNRQFIVFDQVPNPRRKNKPMLLERLSEPGKLVLYFDANGWKKHAEYTFGSFTIATNDKDFSYVAVKGGVDARIVKRGNLGEEIANLFGDCPIFISQLPVISRQDWDHLGDMIQAYNKACFIGTAMK